MSILSALKNYLIAKTHYILRLELKKILEVLWISSMTFNVFFKFNTLWNKFQNRKKKTWKCVVERRPEIIGLAIKCQIKLSQVKKRRKKTNSFLLFSSSLKLQLFYKTNTRESTNLLFLEPKFIFFYSEF